MGRLPASVTVSAALHGACTARTLVQAQGGPARDASVRRGAAGVGHVFHRLARATRDEALATAARAWIVEVLRMQTDAPIAGYPRVDERDGGVALAEDATLLTGCAGVALVLHAAVSEIVPAWDRLLLVDLPI